MFIDTHTHIYDAAFDADCADVVWRAREAGAERLLLPNVDEASMEPMLRLCRRYPDLCYPMMGLQPEELPPDPWPLLDRMEQQLEENLRTTSAESCAEPRYVAVGEVGIDLYWDASRREEQIQVFKREIAWAIRFHLPLVIHCRNAHRELCDTLHPFRDRLAGGIFHCFGGTPEEARELLTFPDFFLGIGGIVTFKRSTLPDTLRECVPIDRIVVETDAPYLTPAPHRGKRNEPAYIPFILAKLAEVYGVTDTDVAAVTTRNAERLFFTA